MKRVNRMLTLRVCRSLASISNGTPPNSKLSHFGGFHVCMCDGALRFIPIETAAATKKAMVTADGGEPTAY